MAHPRLGVLSFVGVLAMASAAAAQFGGGSPVVLDPVRVETVEQYRPVTGELRSLRRALLASEEDGLVVELMHQEGDRVEKGAVIARLRDTRARLDVARAEADLAFKQATVAENDAELARERQDLQRVETLASQSSAAWKELADTKANVAIGEAKAQAAAADVTSAERALEWARERMERMTITAPFTGTVISKRTEVGQWLRQGDPVLEILDLEEIDARLDVPEQFVDQITTANRPVRIRVIGSGEVVEAPMAAIIPDADSLSRLFPVRVRLPNKEGKLRPGMSITGLVPTGTSKPTKTVHKDAVMRDDAGEFVFFDGGGTAAVSRIRTLFPTTEGRLAVEAPLLPENAKLIVEGNERLFPGMPIAPAGAPPAAHGKPSDGKQPEPGSPAPQH